MTMSGLITLSVEKAHSLGIGLMLTIVFFSLAACTSGSTRPAIEGAYERVSLTNTRTGESPEALDRHGLLILGHDHYSMMTMPPSRRALSRDERESLSTDAKLAYLEEWLDINAHSGRYEIDGDTMVWHRDISEDPSEVGSDTRLGYERRNNLLVLYFTLPNGDRYDWIWRKIN